MRKKTIRFGWNYPKKFVCRLSFVHCPQDELGKKYQFLIDFATQSSRLGLERNKCNDAQIFFRCQLFVGTKCIIWRCHFGEWNILIICSNATLKNVEHGNKNVEAVLLRRINIMTAPSMPVKNSCWRNFYNLALEAVGFYREVERGVRHNQLMSKWHETINGKQKTSLIFPMILPTLDNYSKKK